MKSLNQYDDQASSTHLGFGLPAGVPGGGGVRQSAFASKNATSRPTSGTEVVGATTGTTISGNCWTPVKSKTEVPPSYDEETPN